MKNPVLSEEIIKQVEAVGESEGWTVDTSLENNGNMYFTFSKFSPAGRDFSFDISFDTPVELLSDVANEVYGFWLSYDADYETMLWLDENGHGKNGAPHRMRDVLDDSEAIDEMIENLSSALYKAEN